jgi:hypothetical protein
MSITITKALTLGAVRDELRAVGMSIVKTEWDDFRVNYRGGPERTAYYTGDLTDARDTGLAMMRQHMAILAKGGIR